jgi:hypothetical protein
VVVHGSRPSSVGPFGSTSEGESGLFAVEADSRVLLDRCVFWLRQGFVVVL